MMVFSLRLNPVQLVPVLEVGAYRSGYRKPDTDQPLGVPEILIPARPG